MNYIIILIVLAVGVGGYFLYKRGDQDGDGNVDLKDIKVSAKEVAEDAKEDLKEAIEDAKEVAKKVKRKVSRRKPKAKK